LTETGPRQPESRARQIACARCGAEFTCNLHGPCWCGAEAVKLPLPALGQPSATGFDDCLCRDCLHAVAKAFASPAG
jgi:hypothetical protein